MDADLKNACESDSTPFDVQQIRWLPHALGGVWKPSTKEVVRAVHRSGLTRKPRSVTHRK